MKIASYTIFGADGSRTENTGAALTVVPAGKAQLWRVSAHSEQGFDADCAVLFRPELPDGKWFAIENHSPFWCRPQWGEKLSALPKRVQELVVCDGEKLLAVLPLCGDTFKTLIRGGADGAEIYLYANCTLTDCKDQPAFLVMEGESGNPLTLLRELAHEAARVLNIPLRQERAVAPVFDRFGWCSWDALQIRVSHEGLLRKAAEFREKGVPVGFAIIDDMWADVPSLNEIPDGIPFGEMVRGMHRSPIRSFAGDPVRFPRGMAAAIADLKSAGIGNVGVWFPTTGYWAGLMVDGALFKKQKDNLVTTEAGQHIVAPEKEKAAAYFDALCADVAAWGGDFVKIDNQGFHQRYRGLAPIGRSAAAIQSAIDASAAKYFDGALINCMGMPSECMYNRSSAVSRCSDDFMPESREWFAKNILQCAYNGLLQGQFYVNDWDMWWTDDPQAVKNSLCRAISGGPIYVSDKIGRTRPEVLAPVALSDGGILRCDESATPTEDCILDNPTAGDRIFKIRNRCGSASLVAVFNINASGAPVCGCVSSENAGLPRGETAYYEFFSGEAGILAPGEEIPVTLEDNDRFRLYTFVPTDENGIAALGRLDLFVGVGAVTKVARGRYLLREGGKIGFVSRCPLGVRGNAKTERNGVLTVVRTEPLPDITVELTLPDGE